MEITKPHTSYIDICKAHQMNELGNNYNAVLAAVVHIDVMDKN